MGHLIKELATSIGKGWIGIVSGVALGIYGAVEVIADANTTGWVWVSIGLLVVVLVALRTAYNALKERDQAEKDAPDAPSGVSINTGPVTLNFGAGEREGPQPQPAEASSGDRLIEGTSDNYQVVHVWELLEPVAGQSSSIINRTLRYVKLCGPAVLFIGGNVQFINSAFGVAENNPDSIIWPFPERGVAMLGVPVIQNCIIENCDLDSIAFTGPPATLNELRAHLRSEST